MSYGWLTESSLVPKPGKDIENVSSRSLTRLKSLMVQKEEESNKRKRETGSTTTRPTKKFRSGMDLRFTEDNVGVKDRDARDAESQSATTKSFERSRQKLEEKSRLYDAIVSGRADSPLDADGLMISSVRAKSSCLDVVAKQRTSSSLRTTETTKDAPLSSSTGEQLRSTVKLLRKQRTGTKEQGDKILAVSNERRKNQLHGETLSPL